MPSIRKCNAHFRKKLKHDRTRRKHVKNMMKVADLLAITYGCDRRKTKIAGLLHDIAKLDNERTLEAIVKRYFGEIDEARFPKAAWHALAGVVYARESCLIDDEDILNAIMYHTTGRPGMSLLEKIICLADYIEESRTFVSAELRNLAFQDLDKALYISMLEVSNYLKENNQPVSGLTEEAMAYYKSK